MFTCNKLDFASKMTLWCILLVVKGLDNYKYVIISIKIRFWGNYTTTFKILTKSATYLILIQFLTFIHL